MSALTKEQIDALPGLVAEATPGPWNACAHIAHDDENGCPCGYRGVIYGPCEDGYAVCQPGHEPPPEGQEGTEPPRYDRRTEVINARLIALAPSLAATVIEQQRIITALSEDASKAAELAGENEKLRGLLWYAWKEFNAIRARSGAPLDQYQMTTVAPEWWETMLEAFGEAIGDESKTPWPSPAARAALDAKP